MSDSENLTELAAAVSRADRAEAALARVEHTIAYWERTPALRKGTAAAEIRKAIEGTQR
ncbi:hypothetical protein [Prescottella equi]|uniref:hypothetical protein n=1 Tax=Rhodococcus hoagii TaxID=43767 RepID=UPI00158544C2|nr:hypothetical protein [Prescottella equi]